MTQDPYGRRKLHNGKWNQIIGLLQEKYGIPNDNEKAQDKILEILKDE